MAPSLDSLLSSLRLSQRRQAQDGTDMPLERAPSEEQDKRAAHDASAEDASTAPH